MKKFEINFKKRSKPTHLDQWLTNHVIIQCYFFYFGRVFFWHLLWFCCLPLFRICTDDTKYCKHGIDLLVLCETGSFQLIIFEVKGFHELSICYLQVISGLFVLAVGCFKPFLGHNRLFEVVSCLLWVISGCVFLDVGRFKLILAFYRSLQIVSCWLYVVSDHSRSFIAHFRSFQVVSYSL